jgi:hypothetical protein
MIMFRYSFGLLGLALAATPALAANPVALVEDVDGKAPVRFMDYLAEGQRFELPQGAKVVIGYFGSCARETIGGGGKVVIGTAQSLVEGGSVAREKVECDGGRMLLTSAQAGASGVMAFRGFAPGQPLPKPSFTIYGASPVFELTRAGTLYIQRLDKTSGEMELDLAAKDLLGGRFYDFARVGKQLEPGGLYRIATEDGNVVVKVDAQAKPGRGPLVGRFIRL